MLSVSNDTNIIGEGIDQQIELMVVTPGQQTSFTRNLTAGDRVYVDREGGVLSGRLVVTGPDSTEVTRSHPAAEDIQFEAVITGPYTLNLEPLGDFTGSVIINLNEIADDTNIEVSRGETFDLTLSTPGQRATASFDAAVGETFTIVKSGSSIIPRLHPPGDEDGIRIFGSLTYTVEVSGIHQIVLDPNDNFTGAVEFELQ